MGGSIGNWEVVRIGEQGTRLGVRPGYGDSRKISFLCPDYAAILSFSLSLGPRHLSLSLNDCPVNGHILGTLQDREQRERTLSESRRKTRRWSSTSASAFFPELVEMVRQWDEATAAKESVSIDTSFIGTSGRGRTCAGSGWRWSVGGQPVQPVQCRDIQNLIQTNSFAYSKSC